MGFSRRTLRRLERRALVPCPECGYARDDYRPLAVVYSTKPEKSFDGDPYKRCLRCGQGLYVVCHVVYDSPLATRGEGA